MVHMDVHFCNEMQFAISLSVSKTAQLWTSGIFVYACLINEMVTIMNINPN